MANLIKRARQASDETNVYIISISRNAQGREQVMVEYKERQGIITPPLPTTDEGIDLAKLVAEFEQFKRHIDDILPQAASTS